LYEVKLKDYGSVKTYSLRIQELIDEYQAGAEDPSDKISERDHVFFLLNGVPQSEEWDLEIRLITAQKIAKQEQRRVLQYHPPIRQFSAPRPPVVQLYNHILFLHPR
jgi:hypothetical protein